MIRVRSRSFLLVIAAAAGLAASAWAEAILPVNETGTGTWVFDQPSVVADGDVVHLAFVGNGAAGADNASLDTRLYYAAVNGGADFTNKEITRGDFLITAPVAIDNGDAYTSARHPQITLRTSSELAILFQAIPAGETNYKLFLALVTNEGNVVTNRRVGEIRDAAGGRIPGKLTDPSCGIVPSDSTLRVVYSSFPSLMAGSPYSDVFYARVALDNARVADNTILLSTNTGDNSIASLGVSPLPRLQLDSGNDSHIVWAANSDDPTTPAGIYYAMVHAVSPSVVDNIAIGATQVLYGGYRWGFPSVVLIGQRNVWILAAQQSTSGGMTGSVGITEVDPYAVTFDGNPVSVQVLRRDSVKVPAGTFRTVVLKPTIRTKGLFSEGGEAELHISDDDRRMLVFLSVKLSIGTLKLHLKEYEPGTPLSSRRFSTGGRS